MHSFAPFSNLNFFVKNRQNVFAIELMNVEETDSAGMRDEMTSGRTERVEAYGQGYWLYRNN